MAGRPPKYETSMNRKLLLVYNDEWEYQLGKVLHYLQVQSPQSNFMRTDVVRMCVRAIFHIILLDSVQHPNRTGAEDEAIAKVKREYMAYHHDCLPEAICAYVTGYVNAARHVEKINAAPVGHSVIAANRAPTSTYETLQQNIIRETTELAQRSRDTGTNGGITDVSGEERPAVVHRAGSKDATYRTPTRLPKRRRKV